jgi:UDP-2,4-diacetamido-2,4,6-trideoxy-beta-L-altropyranose hydrolase
MNTQRVAIRADGGHEIGYGHLVRTMVLAKELEDQGHRVEYFTKTPKALDEISQVKFSKTEVRSEEDFLEKLGGTDIEVVITDHYEICADFQEEIRERCETYLAISDDVRFKFCCDILVNNNIYAKGLDYEFCGKSPEKLFGTDYILLRDEFQKIAREKQDLKDEVNSALIMMGGGDPNGFTPKVMDILSRYDFRKTVIIGPGFGNKEEIREISSENENFELKENPSNIAEIMEESDIAVSATGTSVYELIATETPFIGIPQTANQGPVAESISRENLGVISEEDGLEENISEIISKNELRKNIQKNQRKRIDGKGAKRILKKINNYI